MLGLYIIYEPDGSDNVIHQLLRRRVVIRIRQHIVRHEKLLVCPHYHSVVSEVSHSSQTVWWWEFMLSQQLVFQFSRALVVDVPCTGYGYFAHEHPHDFAFRCGHTSIPASRYCVCGHVVGWRYYGYSGLVWDINNCTRRRRRRFLAARIGVRISVRASCRGDVVVARPPLYIVAFYGRHFFSTPSAFQYRSRWSLARLFNPYFHRCATCCNLTW